MGRPLGYLKAQVADEAGLPREWSTRLHGSSLTELRIDAEALARTLRVAAVLRRLSARIERMREAING